MYVYVYVLLSRIQIVYYICAQENEYTWFLNILKGLREAYSNLFIGIERGGSNLFICIERGGSNLFI